MSPLLIPDTTADARLSGLEAFLELWLGPRRPEYGEPEETLARVEMPAPLRRFHAFAGRWPPARPPYWSNRFHKQDFFFSLPDPPPAAVVRPSGPYLAFASENQGVWLAATLPSGDDPGVWISEDSSHRTNTPIWRPLEKPLSHYLVTFVLQETLHSSDFIACGADSLSVFADAGCTIEPLWLEGEYAWPGDRQSYYLVERCILLRRDTGGDVDAQYYGFNDPTVVDFVEHLKLPISPL